ncbi:MAG: hypothetical protein GXN92_01835 [Candidatus Micrarchaeota archaeon]|nr:hypothetical protein [Candidatus Micrarchaeota archaeon]
MTKVRLTANTEEALEEFINNTGVDTQVAEEGGKFVVISSDHVGALRAANEMAKSMGEPEIVDKLLRTLVNVEEVV